MEPVTAYLLSLHTYNHGTEYVPDPDHHH